MLEMLYEFLRCVVYVCIIGVIGFFMGRIIPKKWFTWNSFPWRPLSFEKDGKLFEKLKVKQWQNKVPDMSKIFRKLMPAKSMKSVRNAEQLKIMLRETCVAEFIHWWMCLSCLHCLRIFEGVGGVIVCILYLLGNLPFIIIQRYNRPRLNRLLSRFEQQEEQQSLIPNNPIPTDAQEVKNNNIKPI